MQQSIAATAPTTLPCRTRRAGRKWDNQSIMPRIPPSVVIDAVTVTIITAAVLSAGMDMVVAVTATVVGGATVISSSTPSSPFASTTTAAATTKTAATAANLSRRTTKDSDHISYNGINNISRRVSSSSKDGITTDVDVEHILDELGWDGMVGQMCQIDINFMLAKNDDNDDDDGDQTNKKNKKAQVKKLVLDPSKVEHYIGVMGVGSVLNNVAYNEWDAAAAAAAAESQDDGDDDDHDESSYIWTIEDFRRAMITINDVAKRYNRPPVIWGLDSVHGAIYLYDTVISPQPINIAASFNTTISNVFGRLASRDTRRAGINWLFSPLLGLAWNPYWSRVYETFGEDPVLVGDMAVAMTQGIQETQQNPIDHDDLTNNIVIPSKAAACGKHWVGYSFPLNGHDRVPSWIPTRHLYQYFLLPWRRVLPGRSRRRRNMIVNNYNNNNHDGANSIGDHDGLGLVDTVMESYTEVDGVPNAANRFTLNHVLRKQMKFDGLLVTDYHEIFNLFEYHHTASSRDDAMEQAIVEGSVDMSMVANEPDDFFHGMDQLRPTGGNDENRFHSKLKMEQRIRKSARRIVQLKKDLRMFDESFDMGPNDPYSDHHAGRTSLVVIDGTPYPKTSISEQDLLAALGATYESIVLTKNDNQVLPLNGNTGGGTGSQPSLNILVTGPTSTSISFQTGGWTWQWQGVDSRVEDTWFTYGETVLQAMMKHESSTHHRDWKVTYSCGVDILGNDCSSNGDLAAEGQSGILDTVKDWVGWNNNGFHSGIEDAANILKNDADVAIVCLGEENYTEKPGDRRTLRLPQGQYELVAALRESAPDKKIILVYFGGRPMLLHDVVPLVDAVFVGFLPGPFAGTVLANLVAGYDMDGNESQPSGRLPLTYPSHTDLAGVPYLLSASCTTDNGGTLPHFDMEKCSVEWPFGHGLQYSKFTYNKLTLGHKLLQQKWPYSKENGQSGVSVSVNVTNEGPSAGFHSVLFFSFDESRAGVTPEEKRLRSYEKIWLNSGESKVVTIMLDIDSFRFVGPHSDKHYILQDGLGFRIGVGPSVDCRSDPNNNLCTDTITIRTEKDYVGACEAACDLWEDSGCHSMSMESCISRCYNIHRDPTASLNNDGWGWNYVSCLEAIVWENAFDARSDCGKMTTLCRDVFSTSNVDEFGTGSGSDAIVSTEIRPWALGLALFAGLFASTMIFFTMQGGCSSSDKDRTKTKRRDTTRSDIQFSAISTSEGEYA